MRLRNRAFMLVFRVVLVVACLIGILLNVTKEGSHPLNMLSYYTIQSNIVVLVFFGFLLYRAWRSGPSVSPTVKGAVTMCITLTFLVYHFVLSPTMFTMSANAYSASPANVLAHYAVPLMVLADWLLFDAKGQFKPLDPVKWLVVPAAYLVFALVRAPFGAYPGSESRYPYFFLDFDKYGIPQVALNCLFVAIGYALLGYAIFLVDWLASRMGSVWRRHSEATVEPLYSDGNVAHLRRDADALNADEGVEHDLIVESDLIDGFE